MVASSQTSQASVTKAPSNRNRIISSTWTLLPVGGRSRKAPSWVPVHGTTASAWSSSAITATKSMCQSGKTLSHPDASSRAAYGSQAIVAPEKVMVALGAKT